jgi:zeaxanthin glucosyltransferase
VTADWLPPHQNQDLSRIISVFHSKPVARFLIIVLPLTAHLWPAVAIGDALAAQGHDVAFCGPESDLRPLVGPDVTIYPTGKRFYRAYKELGVAGPVREMWDDYLIPLNRFIQDPVDHAVAEYQPDVVLADQYVLVGAVAAHKHGVRWATLCLGALELTPPEDHPGLQDWVRSKVRLAWEIAGLPADDGIDLRFSPDLVIATTVPALTGTVAIPEHCVLVGAALGSRRTDPSFSWDRWDPARRHVLVTAGTLSGHLVNGYITRMMAALALEPLASRVQAVLNFNSGAMPDRPSHVLVAPRVPVLDLMPRLDAVVCQAGQSTVNEALVHGVPMVVAPIRLAEPVVAEQVTRAGAGVAVSFLEATPAQLAAAVTAVLDEPGYRAHARRIGDEYSAAGGTDAAVAHLVALAQPAAP